MRRIQMFAIAVLTFALFGCQATTNSTPDTETGVTVKVLNQSSRSYMAMYCDQSVLNLPECIISGTSFNSRREASLEMRIYPISGQETAVAGGFITVPRGVLTSYGVYMNLDDGQSFKWEFTQCAPQTCVARIGLTRHVLESLKDSKYVIFTVAPEVSPNALLNHEISLEGFAQAYETMPVFELPR